MKICFKIILCRVTEVIINETFASNSLTLNLSENLTLMPLENMEWVVAEIGNS